MRSYLSSTSDGRLEICSGLLQGIARLIGGASPTPRTVEIDTRTAVASVRSTEWLIERTDKGTGVLAIEGEVTVLGLAGGAVVLQPGQGHRCPARRRTEDAGDSGASPAPGCDCPHHDLSCRARSPGEAPNLAGGFRGAR